MSKEVRNLEPKALWNNFADLNEVPRPSKKEERATKFMKEFGEKLGLKTYVDPVGNVIITKPATKGMENRIPIILQGHLDMVAQKNSDVDFDFDSQGIQMYIDGDWVKAKGTTLGADNGIGVATAMTILASSDIAHPHIDALFTIDEETGMTGAMALEVGKMKGKILLNLDSEDDSELTIGCAGGIDLNITNKYRNERVEGDYVGFRLTVNGLKGGHSGMEIHLGRGNANKIMNRILWKSEEEFGLRVATIEGGGLRNAIPRESFATVVVEKAYAKEFENFVKYEGDILISEYKTTDPNANISVEKIDTPAMVMSESSQWGLLNSIYTCQNGIYRMSPDVEGLVQTSNNLAKVSVGKGNISIQCLTRGAVDSEKMDLAFSIEAAFNLSGADVEMTGEYPGWAPDTDASIIKVMVDVYENKYGKKPHVTACHAGLECGIIKETYPDCEMISFGPNIRGPHSPDERVQISSVATFWELVLDTLKGIPVAK